MRERFSGVRCVTTREPLVGPRPLAGEPAKVPGVGFLTNTKLANPSIEPFRRGLQTLGYIEGKMFEWSIAIMKQDET